MTIIETLREKRATAYAEIEALVQTAADEARDLTDDESATFDARKAEIEKIDERVADLSAMAERDAAAEAAAKRFEPKPTETVEPAKGSVRVVAEEKTYRQGGEHSFFADAYAAREGDRNAAERIERNAREVAETRDVGTSAFGALVVPQYLVDLFAPAAKAGRPFLNACRSLPLPAQGMTLNVPRITTETAVAVQATENSAVQETNIDETTLAVSVCTYAGQQDVSRQALERGSMVDQVVFGDLVGDYAVKVNSAAINADGTGGTHLGALSTSGIVSVTYTDASPTVAELVPKIADAIQQVQTGRFLPPTVAVMHPRRWGWLTAAVDSAGRPLVVPNASGPLNAQGVGDGVSPYGAVVGSLMGLPVITDASIPTNLGAGTNEDAILVMRAEDVLCWEEGDGTPRELRFEQTTGGSLTVKLVVYGYSAFTAGRYPKSVAKITGTGLVTPTF
jgi:HK97 family phage major capsid protein